MAVDTQKLNKLTGLEHEQGKEGEWIAVGDHMGCCDCGLVHRMDYRVRLGTGEIVVMPEGTVIETRSFRDVEQTELARGSQGFVCGLKGGPGK